MINLASSSPYHIIHIKKNVFLKRTKVHYNLQPLCTYHMYACVRSLAQATVVPVDIVRRPSLGLDECVELAQVVRVVGRGAACHVVNVCRVVAGRQRPTIAKAGQNSLDEKAHVGARCRCTVLGRVPISARMLASKHRDGLLVVVVRLVTLYPLNGPPRTKGDELGEDEPPLVIGQVANGELAAHLADTHRSEDFDHLVVVGEILPSRVSDVRQGRIAYHKDALAARRERGGIVVERVVCGGLVHGRRIRQAREKLVDPAGLQNVSCLSGRVAQHERTPMILPNRCDCQLCVLSELPVADSHFPRRRGTTWPRPRRIQPPPTRLSSTDDTSGSIPSSSRRWPASRTHTGRPDGQCRRRRKAGWAGRCHSSA